MESQIIIYLFCFKVCHLVGDIQARRVTYAEADLIVLNADEDEHILYNGQLENGNEEDIVSKSTVVSLWECY